MFSSRTVFSGVFDSVVAVDCVFDPLTESSLSWCLEGFRVEVSGNLPEFLPNSPDVVAVVEAVGWRVHHVILAHLADPRVFAVGVAIELALETVVLNLSCCLAEVLVDFLVIHRMIDLDAGLSGAGT
jgi:hypothetical protein